MRALLTLGILWRRLGVAVTDLAETVEKLRIAEENNKPSFLALWENLMAWWRLLLLPLTLWAQLIPGLLRIHTAKFWKAFFSDYVHLFALRFYAVVAISVIILVLAPVQSLLGDPYGGWIIVSFAVVIQPSFESTLQRFLLRILATVSAIGLSVLITFDDTTATSPWVLEIYLFAIVLAALSFLHTHFRYAVYVFAFT